MLTFADARRYFKQSEIILYRQAPDAAPIEGAGTSSLSAPPPEHKMPSLPQPHQQAQQAPPEAPLEAPPAQA